MVPTVPVLVAALGDITPGGAAPGDDVLDLSGSARQPLVVLPPCDIDTLDTVLDRLARAGPQPVIVDTAPASGSALFGGDPAAAIRFVDATLHERRRFVPVVRCGDPAAAVLAAGDAHERHRAGVALVIDLDAAAFPGDGQLRRMLRLAGLPPCSIDVFVDGARISALRRTELHDWSWCWGFRSIAVLAR